MKMKKIVSILLTAVIITAMFTGCSSSKTTKMSLSDGAEISDLSFKDGDAPCDFCGSTDDVCTVELYEEEVGEGEAETVSFCKSCLGIECTYCSNEAKYLCFSLVGIPLAVCEEDLNSLEEEF